MTAPSIGPNRASSEWLAGTSAVLKNMALPAHVVSNFGHAMMLSMARATLSERG